LIYNKLGQSKEAASYFEKSLVTGREYDSKGALLLSAITNSLVFYNEIGNSDRCENLILEGDKILPGAKNQRIGSLDQAVVPENIELNSVLENDIYRYGIDYYNRKKDIAKTVEYYDKLIEFNKKKTIENRKIAFSNIEEKYTNKKLAQKNQELSEEIQTRKRIIITISAILLEELERFTFIASHDLKTPLRNIISFSNLLEKKLELSEDENIHEYLSFIKNGGLRLHNLITDTLEYSQHSNKESNLSRQLVDLNKVLEEIEFSMVDVLKENNAKIIISNRLPSITSHYNSMLSVFQNIIENGIKYNKSDIPTIKIHSQENFDFHSIFIEDNGIGIEEDYQEKIFNMFMRLHTQEEYEGSGLGLSISKKVLRRINGKILLKSKIGEGSTFEIRLPNVQGED